MTKSELKTRLEKSLDFFKSEISQIRTGRATPGLVEDVLIEAYGAKMTLKELASITIMDPQNIIISPWDKGLLGTISKAVRESELKLNPVEESDRLRVPIPSLTEERRKEFTKIVSVKVEDAKTAMRNIRQEAMKDIDSDFSEKLLTEDEKFRMRDEVEDLVKEYVGRADELGENKKEEIMRV